MTPVTRCDEWRQLEASDSVMSSRTVSVCVALVASACSQQPSNTDSGPVDAGTTDTVVAYDTRVQDAAVDATDSTDVDPPQRDRDFTLTARGMSAHDGRTLAVWVVDDTAQQVLGRASFAAISGAEVVLRLPSLVPVGGFHADVFIDENMNGRYDGPATDPSWRVQIPENGSANATVSATDAVMDIDMPPRVARRDLSVHLDGLLTEEFGHRFEFRVIDQGSMATIASFVHPRLPSNASFDVLIPGVVEPGSEYAVDFWIDADGDGIYGGSQHDHSWHATVVTGADGAEFRWTRVATYDELDWR